MASPTERVNDLSTQVAELKRDLKHLEDERDRNTDNIKAIIDRHAENIERITAAHNSAMTKMHEASTMLMTTETNRWVHGFRYFIIAALALNGTLLAGGKAGTILGTLIEGILK